MKVQEIARTPEQLFCHVIMTALVIHDGVTPEVEKFASAVGITNLPELDTVSSATGENPRGYSSITQFRENTPMASVNDKGTYTGSFPSGIFSDSTHWWSNACAFEVSDEVLESWPTSIEKPIWFFEENISHGFELLLEKRDFHGAWLTLNSPGWGISEAKAAINRLAADAGNREFSLLADAWISVADESVGGY